MQCKGENENFEDVTRLRDYVGMRDNMIELKMKTRSSWPDVSVVAPRVPLCESSSWIMRRKMMKTWSSRCICGRPQGASLHSFLAAQTQTQHHSLHQHHPCTKYVQNSNINTTQRQTQILPTNTTPLTAPASPLHQICTNSNIITKTTTKNILAKKNNITVTCLQTQTQHINTTHCTAPSFVECHYQRQTQN